MLMGLDGLLRLQESPTVNTVADLDTSGRIAQLLDSA